MKNIAIKCDFYLLCVFGYSYYSTTPTLHRKKFNSHVVLGIFIGFKPHIKCYLFLNLKNHNIDVSKNTTFMKINFHIIIISLNIKMKTIYLYLYLTIILKHVMILFLLILVLLIILLSHLFLPKTSLRLSILHHDIPLALEDNLHILMTSKSLS